ncbi:transglutaminase-like cysteine peptidase [Polycladidibacter hongkongensis]|uniref:transglutaminase-like cysteine peptidase n=1 Tax=Polycladidibacter hongkongensis TaxID=1647556 RepID=UPI000A92579E|nr:transglutaminase-like cysteine peptidase [Pseudovibrio hongkongensis]
MLSALKSISWPKKIVAVIGLTLSTHVSAQPPGPFMPVLGPAEPPIGHIEFCNKYTQMCQVTDPTPLLVRLTDARWREIERINTAVNKTIRPITDQQQFGTPEFWTLPQLGAGDCEEYVLEKQRRFLALGWPSSALLITVVKDLNNSGHAVLSVRTDKGDLILDNQSAKVLPWYATPYRYVKRQSNRNPARWTAISDRRVTTVASIPR